MSEEITVGSEILHLRDRIPFAPFFIVMASGEQYSVTTAESLVIAKDALIIIPGRRGGPSTLRFNQVSSVDAFDPE